MLTGVGPRSSGYVGGRCPRAAPSSSTAYVFSFSSTPILVGSSVNGANGSTNSCPSLSPSACSLDSTDILRDRDPDRTFRELPLPLVCHPSCPKLPVLISRTLGARAVASAAAAMKPGGGSRWRTRSSANPAVVCGREAILCVKLVVRRRLLPKKSEVVGEVAI